MSRLPEIEDTFSYYSSFETANDNANYEANMLAMQPHYNRGKTELEERESHEQTLVSLRLLEQVILVVSFLLTPIDVK